MAVVTQVIGQRRNVVLHTIIVLGIGVFLEGKSSGSICVRRRSGHPVLETRGNSMEHASTQEHSNVLLVGSKLRHTAEREASSISSYHRRLSSVSGMDRSAHWALYQSVSQPQMDHLSNTASMLWMRTSPCCLDLILWTLLGFMLTMSTTLW